MQYTVRSLSCMSLLLVTVATVSAEETKAPWWHFGRNDDAVSPASTFTPSPTLSPAPETITPVEDDSWFSWPSLPKWQWPHLGGESEAVVDDSLGADAASPAEPRSRLSGFRFGKPAHESRPRNSWAQQPASSSTSADSESTWGAVKARTHDAWSKTVDFVTPDRSEEPAIVASKPRSSWWQRMWGTDEPTKDGPQTVTEWMAQDRIDP